MQAVTLVVVEDYPEFRCALTQALGEQSHLTLLPACNDLPAGMCRRQLNIDPRSVFGRRQQSGAGIGLAGNYDVLDWRLTLAWRIGDPSTSEPEKSPRFWAQAGWRF
jgi:hypothetical protein